MTNSPNAIILTRCQFLSMSNQGAWFDDGSQIYFQGEVLKGVVTLVKLFFEEFFIPKVVHLAL